MQVLARKETEVARRLRVLADGRVLALRPAGAPLLSHPPGQAGLPLTRLELLLGAPLRPGRHRVEVLDGTFPGRVGWKAVVTRPGSRTAVRSSVPSTDPTDGLRHYPRAVISSPLDERVARLAVAPGHGTVVAPRGLDGPAATQAERAGDGFASVFSRAVHGRGALVLLFFHRLLGGSFFLEAGTGFLPKPRRRRTVVRTEE